MPCFRGLTLICCALMLAASGRASERAAANSKVDLALLLGIDVSHSIDWFEYEMQRDGIAHAVRDPDVLAAIQSGRLGRIALSVVQWSGDRSQRISVPWTTISDLAGGRRHSRTLRTMPREFADATNISGMIAFGTAELSRLPFQAARKVIDISGDGKENIDRAPHRMRDRAISMGITINGLVIEHEEKDIEQHYRDHIIGGLGAFVIRISRFEDFREAIKRKLIREIAPKILSRDGHGGPYPGWT